MPRFCGKPIPQPIPHRRMRERERGGPIHAPLSRIPRYPFFLGSALSLPGPDGRSVVLGHPAPPPPARTRPAATAPHRRDKPATHPPNLECFTRNQTRVSLTEPRRTVVLALVEATRSSPPEPYRHPPRCATARGEGPPGHAAPKGKAGVSLHPGHADAPAQYSHAWPCLPLPTWPSARPVLHPRAVLRSQTPPATPRRAPHLWSGAQSRRVRKDAAALAPG